MSFALPILRVGSTNPIKIKAVEQVFGDKFTIVPFAADHGITDWRSKFAIGQPFGVSQTAYGAIHRMQNCEHPDSIGIEDGLIPFGDDWLNRCYIALRNKNCTIIKPGQGVKTEFKVENSFDEAVQKYHQLIMPLINAKQDLYLLWTNGSQTRESCLAACLKAARRELELMERAKTLIDQCAESGMSASNGPRYRYMLWMRDLAYMAPLYLAQGHAKLFEEALERIAFKQCKISTRCNNRYEVFDRCGSIPIVCVDPQNELNFVNQRLSTSFPNMESARKYYDELPIKPSFALRHFMEGTLEQLTPGTRDSEIQFIRALFTLIDFQPERKNELLEKFQRPLDLALSYLFKNVLKDGLPTGADSRDIFADFLYDAKTLTNAIFWRSALQSLVKHQILPKDLLDQLDELIRQNFLFENEQFKPRDFIPGPLTAERLEHPVNPTPVDEIIRKDNPLFITGKTPDPQSLALAVLEGLIEPKHYDEVIRLFTEEDSPIGIQVFVPISGKGKEPALLKAVKGQVVWPHVGWLIVRALVKMGALHMAEEQRDKLMRLGLGEWYAIDPETKAPIQGGDPEQGWSASSYILAQNAFLDFYSRLKND